MRRFVVVIAAVFLGCLLVVVGERAIASAATTDNAVIQRLVRDSQVVDRQWTWRAIYPGRDTMEYAFRLLQDSRADSFYQPIKIQRNQSYIDWTMSTDPAWAGSIFSDNDLPPPHVYAVGIDPPRGYLTLGDVLLIYGLPIEYTDQQALCFPHGACVSFLAASSSGRLSPHDRVLLITYITARVVERARSDFRWQGFRRY
ncbi:MAG: hypothetical protein KF716_22205 [Anaerolineae bacterium]|nr:hypothetical protein [Anaerolineae bacterium]